MMETAERSIDVMKRFDQSLPACARAAVKTGCAHAFHFDQITETRELIHIVTAQIGRSSFAMCTADQSFHSFYSH